MPELPEVETVKRTLAPLVVGERFHKISILNPAVVKYPEPALFVDALTDCIVTSVERRGKYLRILILKLTTRSQLIIYRIKERYRHRKCRQHT